MKSFVKPVSISILISLEFLQSSWQLLVVWREPGFADVLAEESLMNVCFMLLWNFMLKWLQRSKKILVISVQTAYRRSIVPS